MTVDLVLNNAKAYIENKIVDCSLAIEERRIFRIGKEAVMPKTSKRLDLKGLLVLPGLIDAHVHLRDEGKAYKEDFFSGTAAAVAGGFTTVLDMPNNEPVTMSAETLKNRMKLAERKILVNVGFYSEFPKKTQEIAGIVKQGAVAFKLFMAEQVGGLDIDDDDTIFEAFKTAEGLHIPVAVHAEDHKALKAAIDRLKHAGRNDLDAYLEAHSEAVEAKAVTRLLSIAAKTKACIHFCHMTTEEALTSVADVKNTGVAVTCETTPHNLFLSIEDLKQIGTKAVTMPPVREDRHRQALWKAIETGLIDTLGSDHAPHTLNEKEAEDIWSVRVGIPGLETTLPLMLTAVRQKRLSLGDVIKLLSEKPAEVFQLEGRGCLKEGNCADLTVIDLDSSHRIDASKFKSKAKFSPFDGWKVYGRAVKTFVNGQLVMDEGEIVAEVGIGQFVRRA